MPRQFKLATLAALTVSMTALSTTPVDACDRGGSRAFRRHVPFATSHRDFQPTYHKQVYRAPAPVYSQPQPVFAQPQPVVQTPPPAVVSQPQQPVQPATIQSSPAAPSTAAQVAAPQPTAANRTRETNAEATALELLKSLDGNTADGGSDAQIPQFTPAKTSPAGNHVGTWKVSLPNSQAVELNLNADGTFRWTATKDGKRSAFDGQYRLENGRLTLVRSSDLQQMTGSWTANGSNFTFKLDGSNNAGLAFARG